MHACFLIKAPHILQQLDKKGGCYSLSDGVDKELRNFLANGNFNFKKQTLQSEILLTLLLKEGHIRKWNF